MIITGITKEQFSDAIHQVAYRDGLGVTEHHPFPAADYGGNLRPAFGREYSKTRFSARVMLKQTGYQMGLPKEKLAPGQRRSASSQRRIYAVCWHAYRDVLAAVFDINPDARVYTALAKYKGKQAFYELFPETGYQNVGSMMNPAYMTDLCDC